MLKKWSDLPPFLRTPEVKPYFDSLSSKKGRLLVKRLFDYITAFILVILLAVPMAVISLIIKADSKGPVFFRQDRVTTYGKHFKIHKFRTMVNNADKMGAGITTDNDSRITAVGDFLRRYRLDELPQLFDVLSGNMSFVGTRPEAAEYVSLYEPEYYATLLMPAGITSKASIEYKDEAALLAVGDNVERQYIDAVLPGKMKINLEAIKSFSLRDDIKIMFKTVTAVLKIG